MEVIVATGERASAFLAAAFRKAGGRKRPVERTRFGASPFLRFFFLFSLLGSLFFLDVLFVFGLKWEKKEET